MARWPKLARLMNSENKTLTKCEYCNIVRKYFLTVCFCVSCLFLVSKQLLMHLVGVHSGLSNLSEEFTV